MVPVPAVKLTKPEPFIMFITSNIYLFNLMMFNLVISGPPYSECYIRY